LSIGAVFELTGQFKSAGSGGDMQIRAEQVTVRGPHGPLLPPTSVRIADGQLAVVGGEPGEGHTAFALALAGRIKPHEGVVTIDGVSAPDRLRALTAIVDSPDVTEPDEALRLSEVVAEGLALAGRAHGRKAVTAWLVGHQVADHARDRVEALSPEVRTAVLTELAVAREGVRLLVFDRPDRHTSNPQAWWPIALRHAQHGMAVVVLCLTGAARLLPVPAAQLGRDEQPAPLTVGQPVSGALS
jgi:energy-coupling factor transporter ATP-binding protein EcfA2